MPGLDGGPACRLRCARAFQSCVPTEVPSAVRACIPVLCADEGAVGGACVHSSPVCRRRCRLRCVRAFQSYVPTELPSAVRACIPVRDQDPASNCILHAPLGNECDVTNAKNVVGNCNNSDNLNEDC